LLRLQRNFTESLAHTVIYELGSFYNELKINNNKIIAELEKEENKFRRTLEKGLKKLKEYVDEKEKITGFAVRHRDDFGSRNTDFVNLIPGKDAFDLYQTYGFPPELIKEELANYGMGYHEKEFQDEYQKHQELSRTAAAGQFKGGLAEAGVETAKLHTATHLLLAALREVLGPHVYQKGSNITAERLRLDFSHHEKLTPEQTEQAQKIVNEVIRENVPVTCEEMTMEKAKKAGAIGVFESKYGEKVKVYTVGSPSTLSTSSGQASSRSAYSREICGGPHANFTGELGHFRIVKEEASSAGVRRIKAVLE
jgi:alanyl-tRNA synthetase